MVKLSWVLQCSLSDLSIGKKFDYARFNLLAPHRILQLWWQLKIRPRVRIREVPFLHSSHGKGSIRLHVIFELI